MKKRNRKRKKITMRLNGRETKEPWKIGEKKRKRGKQREKEEEMRKS